MQEVSGSIPLSSTIKNIKNLDDDAKAKRDSTWFHQRQGNAVADVDQAADVLRSKHVESIFQNFCIF